jgi:hypothetical protein
MQTMITVPKAHLKLRKKIARDMAIFERKGGKVKHLDQGKIQDRKIVFSISNDGAKSPEFIAR